MRGGGDGNAEIRLAQMRHISAPQQAVGGVVVEEARLDEQPRNERSERDQQRRPDAEAAERATRLRQLVAASLYRRHRPRTFADVVGQEHVVRTLSNAIEQDRVHHAYLFVGSRGTGKTSMAKILAASLNCQGAAGGGTGPGGPTITPCGQCESCKSIASASSLDVVEMDAASNNSVDDIRDLRERVGYAPVAGGYKVYILDEAHMLTPAAWNAFLKTLEEPPPHTIFVLATTEANKVLPTVVDRCHRFDFGRPSVVQIASVLRRVADSESIEIPDEAVALVARSATGSFRDALGTLEQLLAYSGAEIVLDDVLAVLGAADADLLFGTLDAVAGGDARGALLAAARLADSGRDIGRFFGDLEAHARGLLVTQVLGEVPVELHVTPEQDQRLAEQSRRVGGAEIVRLLELIAFALRAMKDGADPRTQLELALVKAAKPDLEPSVKALQERIARLENRQPAPPAATAVRTPEQAQTPAGRATAPPNTPRPPTPARPAPPPPADSARRRAAARRTPRSRPADTASRPADTGARAGRHRRFAARRPASRPADAVASRPADTDPGWPGDPGPSWPGDAEPSWPGDPGPAPAPREDLARRPLAEPADEPRRGLTTVSITAEVNGQPPVSVSTTLPGRRPRQRPLRAGGRRRDRRRPRAQARHGGRSDAGRDRGRDRRSGSRRRPRRASSSRSSEFGESWPGDRRVAARADADARGRARRRVARLARRRRADARVAGVVRVPQAQGRGPGEPRRDRQGDPRGHRQLAAARLRAARGRRSGPGRHGRRRHLRRADLRRGPGTAIQGRVRRGGTPSGT